MPERQARGGRGTERRLRVGPDRGAGGRVPAVPHRDVAAQCGQRWLVEDLGDQAHLLVHHDPAAVADRDARRLLPPVLQRVQPVVGELGDVLARRPDTEHAAGVSWRRVGGIRVIRRAAVGGCHQLSLFALLYPIVRVARIRPRGARRGLSSAAGKQPGRRAGRSRGERPSRSRRPSRAARGQPDPGDRVGLHHVRRRAAGVHRPGQALDRGDRRDAYLQDAAGVPGGEQLQQVPGRGAQLACLRGRSSSSARKTAATLCRPRGSRRRGGISGQPKSAGSVAVCTAASSASGIAKQSSTASSSPPARPMACPGTPCAARSSAN